MNFHLDEDGICRSLAETATQAERTHAENCSHCRERISAAAAEFRELKEALSRAAQRSDYFWARQRHQIAERIRQPRPSALWRWAWGTAGAFAAGILAAALTFSAGHKPAQPVAQAQPAVSDDALLTAIQDDVVRPVPTALEPAAQINQARNGMAKNVNYQANPGGDPQ